MSNSYNYANRKLTYEQAQEIRKKYFSNPDLIQRELAKEYNVSISIIRGIVENRNYLKPSPLEKQTA